MRCAGPQVCLQSADTTITGPCSGREMSPSACSRKTRPMPCYVPRQPPKGPPPEPDLADGLLYNRRDALAEKRAARPRGLLRTGSLFPAKRRPSRRLAHQDRARRVLSSGPHERAQSGATWREPPPPRTGERAACRNRATWTTDDARPSLTDGQQQKEGARSLPSVWGRSRLPWRSWSSIAVGTETPALPSMQNGTASRRNYRRWSATRPLGLSGGAPATGTTPRQRTHRSEECR